MKMAKASQEDLDMGADLCAAFSTLTDRWCPAMPEPVQRVREGWEIEHFDSDNDEQCGRALRHLLGIVERGSLFRVVMGMSVVLDPRNQCVDPAADVLEHHPLTKAGRAAATARPLEEWREEMGPALWWRFPINEAPWIGRPIDDDWTHYHTHFTPLVVPVEPKPEGGAL
jgi:hypothetical protein